jgi:hypothetical protein
MAPSPTSIIAPVKGSGTATTLPVRTAMALKSAYVLGSV